MLRDSCAGPLAVSFLLLVACGERGSTPSRPGAAYAPGSEVAAGPCDGASDRGQRLKCRLDLLVEKGTRTADVLGAPPYADLLTQGQRDGIASAKRRLEVQRARIGPDLLKAMGRKRDAACRVVECDPALHPACAPVDGDGICGKGEDCLEVIGDGAGDDVQPCSPMHGRNREPCVVTCEDEPVCREDSNIDEDVAAELEGVYDQMIEGLEEVNEVLPAAAPALRLALADAGGEDPCALHAEGLERTHHALVAMARIGATTFRTGADVAERLCDQVVFGFNCAACCVALETSAGLLAATSELVATMEGTINSATIDAAFSCVGALSGIVDAQAARLTELEGALGRIEALQAEVVRLLQTPPGRRPNYPEP